MDRRSMFETTATLGLGALAGCALPGTAQTGVKTPFNVPATYVPIVGSDMMFPVRRIYCIGRNYRAHAIEMGSNPDREPPFFFQKPTDAIQNVAPGTVADPFTGQSVNWCASAYSDAPTCTTTSGSLPASAGLKPAFSASSRTTFS